MIKSNNYFPASSGGKKKVFVAMSGGVDSSVAAALLKKRGFDVTGVFMKPWQPNLLRKPFGTAQGDLAFKDNCLWKQDREDAMRVAIQIGIPLLTWDFSKEYKKQVADYMIREYKAGRTPNPDIMCNKHIKFGLFLKRALKEGADHIATGHYIRIKNSNIISNPQSIIFKLYKSKDKNKDQSYFLWTLTQDQLKYCLFPIGDYAKPEVRKIAKKFGLPTANKKDSQGVCFIGPLDMKTFLKNYIKPKKGKILELNKIIGSHDGIFYYTIGQRHGLDIKNGKGPYFVIKKDVKKNILYVGSKGDLAGQSLKIGNLNWINKIELPQRLDVRIRYRARLSAALVKKNGEVIFKDKEIAITPGQSAVFYKGNELLGGGIIK